MFISRRGFEGYVARMGQMRKAYKIFVEKSEGRALGRPRRRWRIILRWTLKK
jgi:hypothetical protein